MVAQGDFNVEIKTSGKDEIGDLSRTFDSIIGSIRYVNKETNQLDETLRAGYLSSRAEETQLNGEWRGILDGVNNVSNTLIRFVDDMPAIFMSIDKEFNVRYINKSGLGALGLTLKEAQSSKCYSICKTDDCHTDNCACGRAIQEGRRSTSETIARPQGDDMHIAYEGVPLRDKTGQVIGAFEFVMNQTDIKIAMEKK